MRILRFFLLFVLCAGLVSVPLSVRAQEGNPAYEQKLKEIEELKGKIAKLQSESKTLSQALSLIASKKALTQKQIEATQFEIALITKDLESLSGKIGVLEDTLNTLVATLLSEVQSAYKQPQIEPVTILFSSKSFSELHTRYKYLELAKQQHQMLLTKTTQAKLFYDEQKATKEKKQKTVEALKTKLLAQQKELNTQEQAQKKLLADTKNSESTYQKLLSQAQAELASFRAFTHSKTGGLLPPQNSPDGWYYSQRDERWGSVNIGNSGLSKSPDSIYEVGCLVTSVAMVKKKYGEDVSPLTIAGNPNYFYLNTGSMRRPWPAPNGYHYEVIDRRDLGLIDTEIREGRPVIVKLSVKTNVVGTHFIVLKAGSNGDYTMHDPWEGYDKKFTQYYSTGQIISIGMLKKN